MRTAFLLSVCLLFCTSSGLATTDYKVINHDEEDGVGSYTVLVPASEFRKEVLLSLATQFLHRYAQLRLLDIGIYTDRASVHDFAGAGVDDYTYGNWLQEFEASTKGTLPCGAEILKSGATAALRIRYTDGRIEEVTINGGNVFHPVIDGVRLDLLHVLCVRQGIGANARLTPLLYFSVSKDISPQDGGAIARSILRSTGITRMTVSLRPDIWFMFDPFYPWVNPFAPVDSPPPEHAKRAWQLLCHPAEEQGCYQVHGRR